MRVDFIEREAFPETLTNISSNSVDVVILISGSINLDPNTIFYSLDECMRILKNGGLLFLQGQPHQLPEIGVYLDRQLNFKYWIAIKSQKQLSTAGLPTSHAATLLFVKGNGRFEVNQVRFPHEFCAYCGKSLRDWGGKSHLMHPDGFVISDVWKNLPISDNYTQLSSPAINTILKMVGNESPIHNTEAMLNGFTTLSSPQKHIIVIPSEGVAHQEKIIAEPSIQYHLPGFELIEKSPLPTASVKAGLWNMVHYGDALQVLMEYPDESIDLAFADPPYNLDKNYSVYDDELGREAYISWCNAWLEEYIRLLKPTGSLFILNLPRWTMYHAAFLNKQLFFQNWIVWDALSEPRGKIMPAHYGLLFYTKSRTGFTFNYEQVREIESHRYCLRASCIRQRKSEELQEKEDLTDIWTDIHRIKHRRDRDYHPCQLPDTLLARIIRLTTNEGDIVLDALAGTGTSAVMAAQLGRSYVAVDIDEGYVNITKEKISLVKSLGYLHRQSINRPKAKYKKKDLQLELRSLAERLGRLPTPEDVHKMSKYSLKAYQETFPSWGKALKAAKLEIQNHDDRGT